MNDDWQNLKVGDRIRIVRLPSAASTGGYFLHAETRCFYKRLIALKKRLTVYEIDRDGLPWIKCALRRMDDGLDYHFLAVNDDSWVRVRSRRQSY